MEKEVLKKLADACYEHLKAGGHFKKCSGEWEKETIFNALEAVDNYRSLPSEDSKEGHENASSKTIFLVYIEYSSGLEPYRHLKEYAFVSNKKIAEEIRDALNLLSNEKIHALKILDKESGDFVTAYVVPRTIDNHINILKKLNQCK